MVLPNSKIKKMLIIFDDEDIKRKKMWCLKITNSSIVVQEDIQLNGM